MATWQSFGKLIGVATLVGFGEKRCRKNLPLADTTVNFEDASTAVADLDRQIALIHHHANPGHPYYADVDSCSYNMGLERGFVYLSWFDRKILAAYAETLTRVDVRSLISIERSDI